MGVFLAGSGTAVGHIVFGWGLTLPDVMLICNKDCTLTESMAKAVSVHSNRAPEYGFIPSLPISENVKNSCVNN